MLGFGAAAIGGRTLFQGLHQGFVQSTDQQACHGHLQAGIPRTSPVLHTGAQERAPDVFGGSSGDSNAITLALVPSPRTLHGLHGGGDEAGHVAKVGGHDHGVVGAGQLGKGLDVLFGHAQVDGGVTAGKLGSVAHALDGLGGGFGNGGDGGSFTLGAVDGDLALTLYLIAENEKAILLRDALQGTRKSPPKRAS